MAQHVFTRKTYFKDKIGLNLNLNCMKNYQNCCCCCCCLFLFLLMLFVFVVVSGGGKVLIVVVVDPRNSLLKLVKIG